MVQQAKRAVLGAAPESDVSPSQSAAAELLCRLVHVLASEAAKAVHARAIQPEALS